MTWRLIRDDAEWRVESMWTRMAATAHYDSVSDGQPERLPCLVDWESAYNGGCYTFVPWFVYYAQANRLVRAQRQRNQRARSKKP